MRLPSAPGGALLLGGAILMLSACGSGGDSSDSKGLCRSMAADRASVQFTTAAGCGSCSAFDKTSAADGDFDSRASLSLPNGGGASVELRATAQSGTAYPAGTDAAVVYGLLGSGQSGMQLRLLTYLNGVQQEQYRLSDSSIVGGGGGDGSRIKTAFTPTLAYDALAISYQRSGGTSATVDIYEFCAER